MRIKRSKVKLNKLIGKPIKKVNLDKLYLKRRDIKLRKFFSYLRSQNFLALQQYNNLFARYHLHKLKNVFKGFVYPRFLFSSKSSFLWFYSWYFSRVGSKIDFLISRNLKRDPRLINVVKRCALRKTTLSPISRLPFDKRYYRKKRLDIIGLSLTEIFKPLISFISSKVRIPFRIVLAHILAQNRLQVKSQNRLKQKKGFKQEKEKKVLTYKEQQAKRAFLFVDSRTRADIVWNSFWDYATHCLSSLPLRNEAAEFFIEVILKYRSAHRSNKLLSKETLKKCKEFLKERKNLSINRDKIIPTMIKTTRAQIKSLSKYDKKTNYKKIQAFEKFW